MNFIAMDFETANHYPESACSLALVMVRNNKIVDRFYTVINHKCHLMPVIFKSTKLLLKM